MTYFYLAMAMTFSATITIGGKLYNIRSNGVENVSGFYNMLVPAFASLGWLVLWVADFSFDARVLPYSLLYGVLYSCFTIGMLGALSVGSTSLTALVKQLALVGVSAWGFVFWDTKLTFVSMLGIIFIVLSLALCLITREEKNKKKNTLKWLFFVTLVVIGNAGCSIIQRYQQMAFGYEHKNMLMFFGLLFSTAVCAVLALRENKKNWGKAFRTSWFCPALTGLSSALSNTFILILIKYKMSSSIIYPGIAVGGLIITILISLAFFGEKLRKAQWFGIAVGAVALVLLNL